MASSQSETVSCAASMSRTLGSAGGGWGDCRGRFGHTIVVGQSTRRRVDVPRTGKCVVSREVRVLLRGRAQPTTGETMTNKLLAIIMLVSSVAFGACAIETEAETDAIKSKAETKTADDVLREANAKSGKVFFSVDELAAEGGVTEWIGCDTGPGGWMCSCGGEADCRILLSACGEQNHSCNPSQTSCSCWD